MTDKEMIQKIKKREEKGMVCLIAQYGKYVAAIIYQISGCKKEDAEEMASDVFVAFWQYAPRFDENRAIKPWLAETARNIAIDHYRKTKKRVGMIALEDLGEVGEKGDSIEQHLQNQMLKESVLELQEPDREIFTRFYFCNEKIKEIAEKLSLPQATVKTKLQRSRHKIKEAFLKGGWGK